MKLAITFIVIVIAAFLIATIWYPRKIAEYIRARKERRNENLRHAGYVWSKEELALGVSVEYIEIRIDDPFDPSPYFARGAMQAIYEHKHPPVSPADWHPV